MVLYIIENKIEIAIINELSYMQFLCSIRERLYIYPVHIIIHEEAHRGFYEESHNYPNNSNFNNLLCM